MTIDPKIIPDTRWTRINDNWETVECFRFTYADGKTVWADTLSPEQAALMKAQATVHTGVSPDEAADLFSALAADAR